MEPARILLVAGRMKMADFSGHHDYAAGCTLLGIIHSPLPNDLIDLPHNVLAQVKPEFVAAVRYQTPYHWAGAYGLMIVLLLVLDWVGVPERKEES